MFPQIAFCYQEAPLKNQGNRAGLLQESAVFGPSWQNNNGFDGFGRPTFFPSGLASLDHLGDFGSVSARMLGAFAKRLEARADRLAA
jgi:hypothetical protein